MAQITVNAQNGKHARRMVKLDDHLGPDITISKVKTLRRANTHGWKEGIYQITYREK